MALYEFEGRRPRIGRSSYVHPAATLIGGVTIGERCYVAAGAVLRADWEDITVGDGSNLQEGVIVHIRAAMAGEASVPTVLGPDSHVGHGAILHAVTLGRHVLIGMGAIVQDRCVLGNDAIIAPGAVVREGTQVPPRTIMVGVPAKPVREITDEERAYWMEGTRLYQELAARSLAGLRRIDRADA